MLCGPHTHSAIVQAPCLQADAILERLIREVLAQGYPDRGPLYLMMAAGQPAPCDGQHEVVFLLCNSVHDRTATVVVDERSGGHPLCSHHVAPQTMCDSLISADGVQRRVSVVVNGAPARLAPKWAMQGDFIQFDEGQGPPPFTPTSWLLRQLPVLLPFTWPLHVGDGVFSLDVPGCARLRRRAQGAFHPAEGGCLVLGIHHGPIAFNLGQPVVPSLSEMQAGLALLDDCPPAMLETHRSSATSISERTVFVSAPSQFMYRTVLAPCLSFAGHYIVYAVLPEHIELQLALPQGVAYRRPQRRHQHGDLLEIFRVARCAWPLIFYMEQAAVSSSSACGSCGTRSALSAAPAPLRRRYGPDPAT
ncbi:Calmodulin [Symbiodinium sp. CCMP2592]|nr:Calmodulin [Symbiodinium sp. CCMP2592]